MRNEVDPHVMKVIYDDLAIRGKQNIYEVLTRLGVRDSKEKVFDYAWEVQGGVPIFTIWAEFVCFHPVAGRMFYVEALGVTTLRGGGAMDAGQLNRALERQRLLTRVANGEQFIAVLQTNVKSIDDLNRNATAKPLDRIKDSDWHVARWDAPRDRAILVRGPKGWAPTDAEVDEYLTHRRLSVPEPPTDGDADDSDVVPGIRFPDQEHRDRVEAAAIDYMVEHYRALGFVAESVESENCGYDLDVKDMSGRSVHLVEVKGTSASVPGFFITANELACAEVNTNWRLAIVTSALGAPEHQIYDGAEMRAHFKFKALAWRCDLRQPSGSSPATTS